MLHSRIQFGVLVAMLALFVLSGSTSGTVIVEGLYNCVEETPFSSDGETCRSYKIENTGAVSSNLKVTISWANETTTTVNLGFGSSHSALCKATTIKAHEDGLPLEGEVTITIVEGGTP